MDTMSRAYLALRNSVPFPLGNYHPKRLYSSQKSTVHRGNAFEERSLKLLEQTMSMSLKRVGGKEDGGIDLLGWWWLPFDSPGTTLNDPSSLSSASTSKRRRIRVIGQCKAEKKKMGPGYVRELEGVLYRFMTMPSSFASSLVPGDEGAEELKPVGGETTATTTTLSSPISSGSAQRHIPMVALLISESPFTKSALLRAHSSPIPFFLLHLPPLEDPTSTSSPNTQGNGNGNNESSDHDHNHDDVANLSNQPLGNLGAAVCNPALSGAQGLLMGQLEVRWERSFLGQQQGRPALWWKNERLLSFTPDTNPMPISIDQGKGERVGEGEGEFTETTTTAAADKIAK